VCCIFYQSPQTCVGFSFFFFFAVGGVVCWRWNNIYFFFLALLCFAQPKVLANFFIGRKQKMLANYSLARTQKKLAKNFIGAQTKIDRPKKVKYKKKKTKNHCPNGETSHHL
jgi:hypothetical protein